MSQRQFEKTTRQNVAIVGNKARWWCMPQCRLYTVEDILEYGAKVRDINSANNWGIKTNHIDIDVTSLVQRKDQVVKTVTDDVRDALRQHNVDFIEGKQKY